MCNHQADSPFYVWPAADIWFGDLQVQKKYGHTWHRISLILLKPGVIKQRKTKPN